MYTCIDISYINVRLQSAKHPAPGYIRQEIDRPQTIQGHTAYIQSTNPTILQYTTQYIRYIGLHYISILSLYCHHGRANYVTLCIYKQL